MHQQPINLAQSRLDWAMVRGLAARLIPGASSQFLPVAIQTTAEMPSF